MVILDTTLSLLTESLRGWQMDATLLVPGIDRWADLRVIGGYASFESPTVGSLEYDSWRVGVDFRPVPAVVLSAMWHENERLFGDQWLFGVGVEVPFETRNLGDGKGGFWRQVKRAFEPRRRHLAERLIEPARRHSLPMQLGTSVERVETEAYYAVSLILPDGQVVRVVERVEGGGGTSAGGSTGSSTTTLGSASFTGGAGALITSALSYDSNLFFDPSAVLVVNQSTSGGTGATSTNGGTEASGGAANLQSTGILNLLGGSSVTNAAGSGTQTGAGTLILNSVSQLSSEMLIVNAGTLNIAATTLDRLITLPVRVSAFYTGGGGREPLQPILWGPNGMWVYGLESYVTSEAGKAAIAALIAQGYTVPAVP
jgi:hypothetical protein